MKSPNADFIEAIVCCAREETSVCRPSPIALTEEGAKLSQELFEKRFAMK